MIPGGLNTDLSPFLPELILAGGILVLLVLNLLFRRGRGLVTALFGATLLLVVADATQLAARELDLH